MGEAMLACPSMWFRRFSGLDCESVAGRRRAATATICALVLGLWSLLVVGAPVRAQAAPPTTSQTPSSGSELVDRVLAVVDADPILLSDISRVVELGQVERRDGEEERAYRRRVLDTLIEQRLRFHEVERFGFGDVPLEEVEAQFAGPASSGRRIRSHPQHRFTGAKNTGGNLETISHGYVPPPSARAPPALRCAPAS